MSQIDPSVMSRFRAASEWREGEKLPRVLKPSRYRPDAQDEWWTTIVPQTKKGRNLKALYREELLVYIINQAIDQYREKHNVSLCLIGARKTESNGDDDRAGIDIIVETNQGELHIQVKSTQKKANKFKVQREVRGMRSILVFVVRELDTNANILKSFLEEVPPFLTSLKQKT